jgi:acyl-coenzyme A thioesterase PaaI-like protein
MLLKETALVRLFGLRIPMILFLGPRVKELDEGSCAIEIPLGLRSRNHLGSMYFGALHVGADLAAGLGAVREIRRGRRSVNLLFAHSRAEFLKRADGDVLFRTTQVAEIRRAVEQADATGERVTVPVEVVATVPARYGDEPVARFTMGLSLKRRD